MQVPLPTPPLSPPASSLPHGLNAASPLPAVSLDPWHVDPASEPWARARPQGRQPPSKRQHVATPDAPHPPSADNAVAYALPPEPQNLLNQFQSLDSKMLAKMEERAKATQEA
eukprot:12375447-Karenia_brevis.AAC.1